MFDSLFEYFVDMPPDSVLHSFCFCVSWHFRGKHFRSNSSKSSVKLDNVVENVSGVVVVSDIVVVEFSMFFRHQG